MSRGAYVRERACQPSQRDTGQREVDAVAQCKVAMDQVGADDRGGEAH